MRDYPIVAVETFIQAIRDTGYKSTASALAELVDNALEARASSVDVEILAAGPEAENEHGHMLRVTDDGCGMSTETMQVALQFGGSTRFNSRRGSGRYGMGLPCSSLSQARRVDVFSWECPKRIGWSYLDVDEIAQGHLRNVPVAIPTEGTVLQSLPPTTSGTVVLLTKCDRLQFKRASTLAGRLSHSLGQTFRRTIHNGAILRVNNAAVTAFDPLFLSGKSIGARPYGPPLDFPVRVPGSSRKSTIRIMFTELPVAAWYQLSNEEKSTLGISKGAGVSVLRNGREIDYGWYFMGGKRRENYDDWWRCQVEFEPALDELFGVTHSKQKINPTESLNQLLTPHVEPIARELYNRVKHAFLKVRGPQDAGGATRRAEGINNVLEPPARLHTAAVGRSVPKAQNGVRGLRYRIREEELADLAFFEPSLSKQEVRLAINKLHPFFENVYAPLRDHRTLRNVEPLQVIELLLLAFARAECSFGNSKQREIAAVLRTKWSDALAAFLS